MVEGAPGGLIVAFIAGEPGMAQRMLAEHTNDGTGHCRVCTKGGQAGRHVWPCPLHGLAEQASKLTPGGAAVSGYSWSTDRHRRQVREHAVSAVLDDGMTVIGAAALWGVQADELQRLVDDARAARQDES